MTYEINPIYQDFFSGAPVRDWSRFTRFNTETSVDFSLTTPTEWKEVASTVMKVVLFPLYIVPYLIQRIVMRLVSMAQNYSEEEVDSWRKALQHSLRPFKDYVYREVTLQRDGVSYNGLLLGRKETITNGKWALFATGNNATYEVSVGQANPYLNADFNVLMVNYPNVGRSQGTSSPQAIGESQELAISFLEKALKAKKIVLSGHSLGGAAISEAIKRHTFKSDVDYLAIRTMTFGKLSQVVRKLQGSWAENILKWIGYEMDQTAASRILTQKKIPEVIFEGGCDEMMRGASLQDALKKEKLLQGKITHIDPRAGHNELPYALIEKTIRCWDECSLSKAG
jgi:hypothetical protein